MVSVPDVNDNTLSMVPQRVSYIVVEKEECEITMESYAWKMRVFLMCE